VKLPPRRARLPGHAVASRMRANEISFFIVPLDPAYKAGLAEHLPANGKESRDRAIGLIGSSEIVQSASFYLRSRE
jgi:hypothetical protein